MLKAMQKIKRERVLSFLGEYGRKRDLIKKEKGLLTEASSRVNEHYDKKGKVSELNLKP